MNKKKKNTDEIASQKRLFLRMRSPSAFGAARRFDSASFMNVPPEMARRDAAYSCFSIFFRDFDFFRKSASERGQVYDRILSLLDMIAEKTEFILSADTIEKRHLENSGTLVFIRRLKKYFHILSNLAGIQTTDFQEDADIPGDPDGEMISRLNRNEYAQIGSIRVLLAQADPQMQAQKEQNCKHFSKSDSERYERAYAFYTEYYTNLENI